VQTLEYLAQLAYHRHWGRVGHVDIVSHGLMRQNPAKTLVGGAGNDSLTATAASVLYGGAGNDIFNIDQAMITALQASMGSGGNLDRLATIDGGSGLDTIKLSGAGITFDLTTIKNTAMTPDVGGRLKGIEFIDITGSGNNTLKLTTKDVLDINNTFDLVLTAWKGRHELFIKGNAGDTVDLADSTGTTGWLKGSDWNYDGVAYDAWYVNTNIPGQVTIFVQQGMAVI
jgi:hypothetical protein